jgi:hypothetical protein
MMISSSLVYLAPAALPELPGEMDSLTRRYRAELASVLYTAG